MDALWTIGELEAEVERALASAPEPASGQVRAVPDLRTIRYYGTLGLIDRPVEMRGRTALYGRRHLLQLVAIKRLQSQGASLADIQERLHGLPDPALERIAELPAAARVAAAVASPRSTAPASPRAAFWRRPPAPVPSSPPTGATAATAAIATTEHLVRVELAPGVHLTVAVTPGEVDLDLDPDALRRAAAPLLAALRHPSIR